MSNKQHNGKQAACSNCMHSLIERVGEAESMFCTLNPPTTVPIVVVITLPTGQMVPNVLGWVSNYPTVHPEKKCGQYKRQLDTIEGVTLQSYPGG